MGGAVFARHQGQVQHFATRQCCADFQARAAAFFSVHVILRQGDHLVHWQFGTADDHACHELGQGCNGQHSVFIFAEQYFAGVLVDHQSNAGFEVKGILRAMKTSDLAI